MIRTEPHRTYAVNPTYTYFITDSTPVDSTSQPPLAALTLSDCPNICDRYRLDVAGVLQPQVFVTDVPATQGGLISTSQASYDESSFTVSYRGLMPVSYRTNCVYYFNAFTISMVYLKIIPTTFADLVYVIGDPLASYRLTAFSLNHPAYAANPRFTIVYELIDARTGLAPIAPVTEFLLNLDNTLRTFDLQTYGVSVWVGTYDFKWRAKFADYNPSY